MTAERFRLLAASEMATASRLRDLGNDPQAFGTGQLSERARQLQKLDDHWPPDLNRWLQDNLVRTVTGETVYADAKFSFPNQRNHSIEMRSLLAALIATRDVWFIFSQLRRPATFTDFKPMRRDDVPTGWPCCDKCGDTFHSAGDPFDVNAALPRYCPQRDRLGPGASGTPFFVVHSGAFFRHGDPFGLLPAPPGGYNRASYGDYCRDARSQIYRQRMARLHKLLYPKSSVRLQETGAGECHGSVSTTTSTPTPRSSRPGMRRSACTSAAARTPPGT